MEGMAKVKAQRGESGRIKQLQVAGRQSSGHAGVKFLGRGVEFGGRVPEGGTYRVGADGDVGTDL